MIFFKLFPAIILRLSLLALIGFSIFLLAAIPELPEANQKNTAKSCAENYPAKGDWGAAFFDLINGGTCWSCPKGYNRPPTIFPVNSDKACTGFEKADKVGKYGCKNKYGDRAFRDAIQGGTCWTCPKGYIRTAEPVTHAKACAKDLIFGPWSRADKKGSDKCDEGFGDPIDGGTCWKCPKNTNRTVFRVDESKACEGTSKAQYRGPDAELIALSVAAKANIRKITQDFSDKAKPVMTKINEIYTKVNGPLKQLFTGNQFSENIKKGNYNAVWGQIKSEIEPLVNELSTLVKAQEGNLRRFTVMSISIAGSATVGVGFSVEEGLLIDFANGVKLKGFYSYGVVGAPSLGLSNAVTVGLWKNDIDCGAGFGINVGFSVLTPIGLSMGASGGIAIDADAACKKEWANFLNLDTIEGISISITAGVGVGSPVEIGVNFSAQMVYEVVNGKLRDACSDCGSQGQRACSLVERFPSCNIGLTEQCGECQ
jgi:hypothetical protein